MRRELIERSITSTVRKNDSMTKIVSSFPLFILLLALALMHQGSVLSAADPVAAQATVSTQAQAAAIDALIEVAVQHGLPDARGATLVQGKLALSWTGTAEALFALPLDVQSLLMPSQITFENVTMRGEHTNIHLRLADGSMLVRMQIHADADSGAEVKVVGKLQEFAPADWFKARANGGDQITDPGSHANFCDRLDPQERAAVLRGVAINPVIDENELAILAAIHLWRMGAPGAEDLARSAVMSALRRTMGSQDRPYPLPVGAIDLGLPAERLSQDNRGYHSPTQLEPTIDAMRRALRIWSVERLIAAPASSVPAALTAALALAEGDSAEQENLRCIAAGRTLSRKPLPTAPLIERAAAWFPPTKAFQHDRERGSSDDYERINPNFVCVRLEKIPPAVATITNADADALIVLLDDHRPSRWVDRGSARSLGDNALRALAHLVQADPRVLAGRNPDAVWSDAERTASAKAIAAWWSAQGGVIGFIEKSLPNLALSRALTLIAQQSTADQRRLQAALGRAWTLRQPTDEEIEAALAPFSSFLVSAQASPEVKAAISGWTPKHCPLVAQTLACWMALSGDATALEKFLAVGLQSGDDRTINLALELIDELPTRERLALVDERLRADPDSMMRQVGLWMLAPGGSMDDLRSLLRAIRHDKPGFNHKRERVLYLTILDRLLGNETVLPQDLITLSTDGYIRAPNYSPGFALNRKGRTTKSPGAELSKDLRWCDIAVFAAGQRWKIELPPLQQQSIDLPPERGTRDLQLNEIRPQIARLKDLALEACELSAAPEKISNF